MRERRIRIFLFGLMFVLIFLAMMLLRICIFKRDAYSQKAASQRAESIVMKESRGIFYDRNMIPLVEAGIRTHTVGEEGPGDDVDGSISIRLEERYGEEAVAPHIIGYVDSDGNGVSGLEKCFDKILKSTGTYNLNVITSASGKVIQGAGASVYEEFDKDINSVKLTIDRHIQKIAETQLDKSGFDGAVVVMDVKNSDILAMASSPFYDRNELSEHINSDGTELVNRCISEYNAGSIFKIITLIAAMENENHIGLFDCRGSVEIGDRSFACHKTEGHGVLDFEKAFSGSCNCAFYEMGIKTGAKKISETAKRFGIGERLLCFDGLEEAEGNVSSKSKYGIFESVNHSIGQGEILITPVQAANMACIIANNGIANCVNIADCIVDSKGAPKRSLREINERRIVDFEIARKIQNCMYLAVKEGTASGAKSDVVQIAGKTGTAETGWVENGENYVHGWFCGYFPYDNPKYAMAVLIENGRSGSRSAVPVFKNIAEEIIKFYPIG